tara:strand:+ start:806 stop:1333 length:528 start_codon:yes stop_codon:yes gene_type:complete
MPWRNGRYISNRSVDVVPSGGDSSFSVTRAPSGSDIEDQSFTESVLTSLVVAGSFTASFLRQAIPKATFTVKSGLSDLIGDGFISSRMLADGSVTGSKISNSIKVALITGGSAGAHTVAGIRLNDQLIAVLEQNGTSGILTDLTAEFSIKKADTIDNTGGTATSSDKLLIFYLSR